MNKTIKYIKERGVLVTNDQFLIAFFKSEVQGRIHDSIDVQNNMHNTILCTNRTYYIDDRVIETPSLYSRLLEIDLFSGGQVWLMNFNRNRFITNGIDMRKSTMELIKEFEVGMCNKINNMQFSLTKQEIKVLSLITSGISSNSLSKKLGLSVKTIHSHKNSAVKKLGFKNFNAFISIACRQN